MNSLQEAQNEANKCLNCKVPMCQKGCPISTHIPQFIEQIKNGNLEEAYKILQENNIMSNICSNVCPYEECCVGNCIKGIKGEPIQVNKLEKYVNNWARKNNVIYVNERQKSNNIKIAVVGSGPAGIECAVELSKKGFEVTIFEKEEEIGGLLTYGIPGFRLPRDITQNLTRKIKSLGINIQTNIEFGKDITIESLKKNGYKAIFVAIGAETASTYHLTNKECNKIHRSDYILKEYNAKRIINDLGNVIIIGGGNVATDSARAAIRMGAKSSTIVYRRNREKMPAREIELEEAMEDGVEVIYNTKVLEADVEEGKIQKVRCIKTDTTNGEVKDIKGSEFYINADTIIFAIGLKPNKEIIEQEKIQLENGLIKIDENCQTNIEGVFAGGDVCQSKATVCLAIKAGKEAAKNMEKYINTLYN